MDIEKLNRLVENWAKMAAAPEFLALRKQPNLWFSKRMATVNNDLQNFAVFDNKNLAAIRNLEKEGLIGAEDIVVWYWEHPKTQELAKFICTTYNRTFPNLYSGPVLELLENQFSDGVSNATPIFLLIHDLIHQVLQHDFVEQLANQEELRNYSDHSTSLLDQIYEDIASNLSNFQPRSEKSGGGQGLFYYLRQLFGKNYKYEASSNESALYAAIQKTFHYAKAELRNKIDGFVFRMPDYQLKRYEMSGETPAAIKQIVDGILSKAKNEMLQKIPEIVNTIDKHEGSDKVFEKFDLGDIFDEYHNRILESRVIDQADSSALRGWMQLCLRKMKEVNQYFEHGLEEELYGEYAEEENSEDYDSE